MGTIAFIHTVSGLTEEFTKLCGETIPNALLCHISDESIIRAILAAGEPTPSICRRVCEHVVHAEREGCCVVQITCSTVSPCVEVAARLVSIPVLKVDEAAIVDLVARHSSIGVIATNPATLGPTGELLRQTVEKASGVRKVEEVLCEGAYDAYLGGDLERHDRIVLEYLGDLSARVDGVLLAQASMARVAAALEQRANGAEIVTTPGPAVRHLGEVYRTACPGDS